MRLLTGLAFLLLVAWQAVAAPAATVEAVQMPAWMERSGRSSPLTPGMELRSGDQVRTGPESRVLIKLGEGSLVKLGENAALRIAELAPASDAFKAVMNVLRGAFRFTTAVVAKERRREVSIRIATVTVGIRGTDVWGRSRDEREIVCLIEGSVEVAAEAETPLVLDRPRQFYQRQAGKTQPVGEVGPQQLAQWAKETDIEAGKGAVRRRGAWKVQLLSTANARDALQLSERVRQAGYPAAVYPEKDGEKRIYRVRIQNLPARADAQALAARLRASHDVPKAEVRR
jgi:hypothetical protein